MTQYVIFVDDTLMLGAGPTAAAGAGAAAGALEGFGPTASVAGTLAQRRSALVGMAAAISGQPGSGGGPGAAAAIARAVLESFGTASDEAAVPKGMDVLEGIGAIVVDDAEVDIAALSQVIGLEVVENIDVYLPEPVASEASAGAQPLAFPPADWHLTQIGLTANGSGGRGTIVGVLDTGIEAGHAEFAGKIVHFAEFNAAGRQIVGAPARDAGDHGTHVCSTIAGKRAGVAPDAGLAVAAVLTQINAAGRNFGSLIQIVNGFNWLVVTQFGEGAPGVDLINASLGGSGFNVYLQRAVAQARGVGIGLIAAIGNDGQLGEHNHGSPGNYPDALGIGASDSSDTVADFSDWGNIPRPSGPVAPVGPAYPVPALSAPGVDVLAAQPGGGFQRMSGTSMATPVVAGVAARRIAAKANLRRNPSALFLDLQAILAPVTPHGFGNQGGAGRIVA